MDSGNSGGTNYFFLLSFGLGTFFALFWLKWRPRELDKKKRDNQTKSFWTLCRSASSTEKEEEEKKETL